MALSHPDTEAEHLGQINGFDYLEHPLHGTFRIPPARRPIEKWDEHSGRWRPIGSDLEADIMAAWGYLLQIEDNPGLPAVEYRLQAYSGQGSMVVKLTPAEAKDTNQILEERGLSARWVPVRPGFLPITHDPPTSP